MSGKSFQPFRTSFRAGLHPAVGHSEGGSILLAAIVVIGVLAALATFIAHHGSGSFRRYVTERTALRAESDARGELAGILSRYDTSHLFIRHPRVEFLAPPRPNSRHLLIVSGSGHGALDFRPRWDLLGSGGTDGGTYGGTYGHLRGAPDCTTWIARAAPIPYEAPVTCTQIGPLRRSARIAGNLEVEDLSIVLDAAGSTLVVFGSLTVRDRIHVIGSGRLEVITAAGASIGELLRTESTGSEIILHAASGALELGKAPEPDWLCPNGFRGNTALRLEALLIVTPDRRERGSLGCALDHPPDRWRRYGVIGAFTPTAN